MCSKVIFKKAIAIIISMSLIISLIPLYSVTVNAEEDQSNYVNGEITVRYTDGTTEDCYNKECKVDYSDEFFTRDNSKFDLELAKLSVVASEASFTTYYDGDNNIELTDNERDTNLKDFLTEDLKFTDYKSYRYDKDNSDTRDLIPHAFARKTVNINGEDTEIVAVGVRSGIYFGEWYSNCQVAGRDYPTQHNGFSRSAEDVYSSLKEYFKDENIDTSKVKVWLFGFSRGAAIANILGANLLRDKLIGEDNLYCYCNGTPKTTKNPMEYDGIFNVILPIDMIPKVPPAYWNYSWYGKTIALPDKTNDWNYADDVSSIKKIFADISNGHTYDTYANHFIATETIARTLNSAAGGSEKSYEKYFQDDISKLASNYLGHTEIDINYVDLIINLMRTNGIHAFVSGAVIAETFAEFSIDDLDEGVYSKFIMQHLPETYLAFLEYGKTYDGLATKLLSIGADVNVCIYDKKHNLVAKIRDNHIKTVSGKNKHSMLNMHIDANNVKKIYIPNNCDYTVELEANDDCSMNYSIDEIGDNGITEEKINYSDIELSQGDTLDADINAGNSIDESSYNPTLNNEVIIKPTDILENDEINSISVDIKVKGDGIVFGSGQYTKGDSVTLKAEANEGSKFIGWYINNILISADDSYGIESIEDDIDITAKFAEIISEDNVAIKDTKNIYNGKSIRPEVIVKSGNKILVKNTDYKVTYEKDSKNLGKHILTVTGIGDFTGTVKKSYIIAPFCTGIKSLSSLRNGFYVKWYRQKSKMSSDRIDGYEIKYSNSKKFENSKTVTVRGYFKSSKKIRNLKDKKYYVKLRTYVTVSGKKYYSSWSKIKAVNTR